MESVVKLNSEDEGALANAGPNLQEDKEDRTTPQISDFPTYGQRTEAEAHVNAYEVSVWNSLTYVE